MYNSAVGEQADKAFLTDT